jgi:YVTN family beta-propeller protein
LNAQQKMDAATHRILLPNGWSLSPAGESLPLGDLPLNIAVNEKKQLLAVTNNGQSTQSIQLFDAKNQRQLDEIEVAKAWYGLQFSRDGNYLFASGGNDNLVLRFRITEGKLSLRESFLLEKPWPVKASPAGIALDEKRQRLYVVTRENNSLYIFDLSTRKKLAKIALPAEAYTCLLSNDGRLLYISCWGCDKVLIFDTEKRSFKQEISVGDNPNEMLLTRNNRYLFVCNSNDNDVSIIDLQKHAVIEKLNAALYPNSPPGSTTNGLAISSDEKTLYVANADNNCLAVFDVAHPGQSRSRGFIPTGWYPSSVRMLNNKIWVANGKGFSSMANPYGPNPVDRRQKVEIHEGDAGQPAQVQYIASLFKGSLSIIPPPNQEVLKMYTAQVYSNTPYSKKAELIAEGSRGNPIPIRVGDPSPIKYVFYIIKENRTYDQVLGDMPEGNGDTSMVLFGEHITPNQHALAREFVLLDNFYVDAEVSADGHSWSMGAYATDYLEKTWPTNYGHRGGVNAGAGRVEVANNKNGYIWAACKRKDISYRSYGEFVTKGKAHIPELKGHVCRDFEGFNLQVQDTLRFNVWKRDFDSLLAIRQLPRFNVVRFGNDHTEGLKLGRPTPYAHVADNDLAVGMLIQHLAESPIWKETAVFILEDDAQNGADHVDAHRSTAYVMGGMVKRNFTDHTPYTTSSMLRTIELILGIPPMTQYDAAATPMWRCFDTVARPSFFKFLPANIDLGSINQAQSFWQQQSEKLDFAKEDEVPDLEFNKILWHGLKGDRLQFPAPRRAAFVQLHDEKDEDD